MALYLCGPLKTHNPSLTMRKISYKIPNQYSQNCQGHQKQGISKGPRGAYRDITTKYNVISWWDPDIKKGHLVKTK